MIKRNTNLNEIYYPKTLTQEKAEYIFKQLNNNVIKIYTPTQLIKKNNNIIRIIDDK